MNPEWLISGCYSTKVRLSDSQTTYFLLFFEDFSVNPCNSRFFLLPLPSKPLLLSHIGRSNLQWGDEQITSSTFADVGLCFLSVGLYNKLSEAKVYIYFGSCKNLKKNFDFYQFIFAFLDKMAKKRRQLR